MAIEHFWVFALAALLLNLTPGNDMLYVAARSTSQGIKAGIISSHPVPLKSAPSAGSHNLLGFSLVLCLPLQVDFKFRILDRETIPQSKIGDLKSKIGIPSWGLQCLVKRIKAS